MPGGRCVHPFGERAVTPDRGSPEFAQVLTEWLKAAKGAA